MSGNIKVEPLYLGKHRHGQLFAALGIVGFAVNLIILFAGERFFEARAHKIYSSFAVGAWFLLPPLWFFYEFFYYFPKHGNPAAGFDRLKSVQDTSSKVWAAVAAVLAGIYSGQFS